MDPLSHLLATAALVGRGPAELLAGLAPDLPWYLLYPLWLHREGRLRQALRSGHWPLPPRNIQEIHLATHSLLTLGLVAGGTLLTGRRPGRWLWAWLGHILLDLPTHSRGRMAPQPLWPISRWAMDGLSWADTLAGWLARE